MSSEGISPVTDNSNGRGRGRSRGRGRGGRANRGHGRGRFTNGASSERDGASQSVSHSTAGQDIPADESASTPVSASSVLVAQTSAPSSNGSRGQPRRKSNASRGTSGNHPPPAAPDPPKSAAMKEVPPHLAGPGLDADVLVNKVKALATHSKNSSVDSRYVPAMGLDWADEEEDPESLPDLSQWAVPKSGIVVDQMQSVKEEEPALPEHPKHESVPSDSQDPVADATAATNTVSTEQAKTTEETSYDQRQSSKPKPKRKDKREPREPGGLDQPLTPTQEGSTKRKTLFERISGLAPPPASEQESSTLEPPTSDKDVRLSGMSSEPDSRAPYPNRGRGRGRGRGHAHHLTHLPFHPANVQRRQQAAAAAVAPPTQQTATSSGPRHEKPTTHPPRSQERPHTRPVIDKGALARIGLSLTGPKPPAGSPRQPPAIPS